MTPSAKDRDGKKVNADDRDGVGPRAPRWAEPRPKSPIAVALDYKHGDGRVDPKRAPRVAATGRGAVAEQILEIAFAKGVPVRQDPDLAQLLVTLDVDSVIPVDALSAVAEILSYLYRLNGKVMDGEATDSVADGALAADGSAPRERGETGDRK
jgi:flagellar biosynthesis protein